MYCTLDDLKGQVSEGVIITLTDDEGNGPATLAEATPEMIVRIDKAIENAASEINGYCQARYPVPFNPVPDFVRKLAIDVALYNLFSRRGYNEDSADKQIYDRYKTAVKTLENIAKGLVTLGVPQPTPSTEVEISSSPRIFSRTKMEAF